MYKVICCNSKFQDRLLGAFADHESADNLARSFTERLVGQEWPEYDNSWRFVRVECPDGTIIRR